MWSSNLESSSKCGLKIWIANVDFKSQLRMGISNGDYKCGLKIKVPNAYSEDKFQMCIINTDEECGLRMWTSNIENVLGCGLQILKQILCIFNLDIIWKND